MGWLTGRCGLSLDNLVGAQVVLADGRIVHAAERDHADLFWALRGGGGNFGVVTEFEFALHEVGPEVHLGLLFWVSIRAVRRSGRAGTPSLLCPRPAACSSRRP
jgi:FAD/FMN-containing dehydrogenase